MIKKSYLPIVTNSELMKTLISLQRPQVKSCTVYQKRVILLLGMLVLFVPVASWSAMKITVDSDPDADFSSLKTYIWMSEPEHIYLDPEFDHEFLRNEIKKTVKDQLADKGFNEDTSGIPDFLIGYHAAIRNRIGVTTWNNNYDGYNIYYGMIRPWTPMEEDYVWQIEEGSLVLDIIDPAKKKLIWRSSAHAEVTQSDDIEKRRKRINEAVEKMLRKFPPK